LFPSLKNAIIFSRLSVFIFLDLEFPFMLNAVKSLLASIVNEAETSLSKQTVFFASTVKFVLLKSTNNSSTLKSVPFFNSPLTFLATIPPPILTVLILFVSLISVVTL